MAEPSAGFRLAVEGVIMHNIQVGSAQLTTLMPVAGIYAGGNTFPTALLKAASRKLHSNVDLDMHLDGIQPLAVHCCAQP